jgi:hypothetical protein
MNLRLFAVTPAVLIVAACSSPATPAAAPTATAMDLHGQCITLVTSAGAQQNTESAASVTSVQNMERGKMWAHLRGSRNVAAIKAFQRDLTPLTDPSLAAPVKHLRAYLKTMLAAVADADYTEYTFGSGALNTEVNKITEGPCKKALA